MAAVTQDITAEQGAALAVTLTGAGASLQGRTLRMHVRSKVGVTTTKFVAGSGDGRLTVGASPYTTAALAIDADVMAAVSITLPVEYWTYDVESYTTAADVRREWSGRFTISRDVTRDTEATTEDALAGLVRYDSEQSLTTAQKLQARTNIGAGTGGGGGSAAWGDITGTLSAQTDLQSALDLKATLASPTLTGTPAAPTAAGGTSTTQIATTAFTAGEITTHAGATDPHGDRAFATSAVSTHAGAVDPHGDRAYADGLAGNYATAAQGAAADSAVQDVGAEINAATAATLDDADAVGFFDSVASALRKITWANVKATIKTYTDTLYSALGHGHANTDITGLGGAAVLAVGTTAGTVAAGDDSRMTDDRTASGIRETSGPTLLVVGAIADGEFIKRVGSTAVGGTPASGGTPGGSSGQGQYNNAGSFDGMPFWVVDANTVWQYNSTTAQMFYVANTRTDASNYERAALGFASNVMILDMQKAGTGTARNFSLRMTGVEVMSVNGSTGAISFASGGGVSISSLKKPPYPVSVNTSTTLTLAETDAGREYALNSASDQNWTLPAVGSGAKLFFGFIAGSAKAGSYMRVTAPTGISILLPTGKSATAGYVRSNSADAVLNLRYSAHRSLWVAEVVIGTWTIDS